MSRITPILRPLAVLGVALALAATNARPAAAHAELRASEPAEGAILAAPPASLRLLFTTPMQVTSLRLLDEAGRDRPLRREGSRTAATTDLVAALTGSLPPGAYRVEYRGLSVDGHVGSGVLRFRVGPAAR